MNIAVIGTGMVGRALAGRLAGLGHDVVVGTRDVEQTLVRPEPGSRPTPKCGWCRSRRRARTANSS
jgi:predicted dinucleotide-binding enzyme